MRQFLKARRSSNLWVYAFSVGLFAALVGSLPYRMVSFYHYLNLFLQLCVVLAVASVLDGVNRTLEGAETVESVKFSGM